MKVIQRLAERLVAVIDAVSGILMAVLTLVVFAAVVSRYFFNLPIQSTSETAGLVFAWAVFLTTIGVTHREDHIAVTFFREKLPAAAQKAAEALVKLLMMVFVLLILSSSVQMTMGVMNRPLPALRISSAWLNGSVAVAFIGVAFVLFPQVVLAVRGRKPLVSAEEELTASLELPTAGEHEDGEDA